MEALESSSTLDVADPMSVTTDIGSPCQIDVLADCCVSISMHQVIHSSDGLSIMKGVNNITHVAIMMAMYIHIWIHIWMTFFQCIGSTKVPMMVGRTLMMAMLYRLKYTTDIIKSKYVWKEI